MMSSNEAYTLVEVMIAALIFSIVGFGTLTGLIQSRRLTEGSIYLATATTVAQGYIEQMKNMEFSLLDEAVIPELNSEGQADSLAVSPLPADPELGDLQTDIPNTRTIDINNTPQDPGDDFAINFVVYVDNITNLNNGVGDSRRIILRWSYLDHTTGGSVPVGNTLYAIRSRIPTF